MSNAYIISRFFGAFLAEIIHALFGLTAVIYKIRNGSVGVRFKRQRSGVIGTNQHSYFLPLKFLKYRSQYQLVYQLDGFNFIFRFKTMSAFVGSFNMNVNKVASALKRVYRRFCFYAEIGVYI